MAASVPRRFVSPLLLLLLGLLALATAPSVFATDYFVAPDGDDHWSVTGTIDDPFASIGRATWEGVAGAGDRILLRGGTYLPDDGGWGWIGTGGAAGAPLVVRPYQNEQVVIDGSQTGSGSLIGIGASHVVVEGLEVRQSPQTGITAWGGDAGDAGITDIVIRDNVIHDCARGGIYVGHAIGETTAGMSDVLIEGNSVFHNVQENGARTWDSGWASAIAANRSEDVIVRDNHVYENFGEGINAVEARRVQVLGNVVHDNYSVNLYIDRGEDTRHEGNLVYSSGNTVYFRELGGVWLPASGLQIANENETDWSNRFPSSGNVIVNNVFVGNRNGLHYGNYQAGGGMQQVLFAFNTVHGSVEAALDIDADSHAGSVVANNIWTQDNGAPLMVLNGDLSGITFANNLWFGGTPDPEAIGSGDVFADPLFADPGVPSADAYRLAATSPAIGAGTALADAGLDFDGDPRATPPTLGAFEPEPTSGPRTFHVSTAGDDGGDGSASSPWRTLTHAAAQALEPGDRVLIEPGIYQEDLSLTRSGAEVVPVTADVSIVAADRLRFPVGTDLSGLDLADHAGEYYLYVYRSWRANNGVYPIVATGSDADGPWVQVAGADFRLEDGAGADLTRLSAAIGRPIIFRNASSDPANERVVLDASADPSIYTVLYIGDYIDPMDANGVDWTIVDGIDVTGSHQGGGLHIQDSSFNVVMNSRVYDLQGAGILIAGNASEPARYNLIWNNHIWNTPDEGVYVGAGGHGEDANHAYWTHVVGNDISTQGSAANAVMENAIDLKEYNIGDLVEGNLIHDYDLMTGYNGAIDIRNGKRDVLVYNNVLRDIGRATDAPSSLMVVYGGSEAIVVANNLLFASAAAGNPVHAFDIDGTGSSDVAIVHNTVRGTDRGLLLQDYGSAPDVTIANNVFDFLGGGFTEWGSEGRFALRNNLYADDPGGYAGEPGRIVADPLWLDPAAGDFHLQTGSPAADAGGAADALLALDPDGISRLADAAPDRGAFELISDPQPPVAAFTASPTQGVAPLTVQFVETSSGAPTGVLWDFGDGATSSESDSTSHVYSAPGTYTVALTVTNDQGNDTLTRTDLIQVAEPVDPPSAGFTAGPTSGEAPLTVQFTDASVGAESWSWDFGDGNTSTAQNPSHLYTEPGSYSVVQTVANAGGSDSATLASPIEVLAPPPPPQPPLAAFAATPTTGTAPLAVQFADTSGGGATTSWSWDFGDGSTSTAQHPSHVYDTIGSYDVTLSVANADGSDSLTRDALIVVVEPGARETILVDGFEAGLDAWWTEGNVSLSGLDPKHGDYAMRFTGNNIWVDRDASTEGYEQIRLSAWIEAQSFEDWEYLILYWSDGSDWYEPASIETGHPAAGGNGLTLVEIDLPASAADNPDFAIAFGMWGTDSGDIAVIDDVLVTGVPLGGGAPAPIAGETGSMTLTGSWADVPLLGDIADPVIIAGPATQNDADPGIVRLRNVADTGFQARFEEWNYLDRNHGAEQAAYLALPIGRHTLADGSIWEIGRFTLNGTRSWSSQSFAAPLPGVPALFLTAQTSNGGQTATVRAKAVTNSGFKAALYEQESLQDGHTNERIGYLAIYPAGPAGGTIDLGGATLDYGTDLIEATHHWTLWETAVGDVELRVEEEQSADSETNHVAEDLSVMELDGGIFCQDVETQGGNTAACRMR